MYTIHKSDAKMQTKIHEQIKQYNAPFFPEEKYYELAFHMKDDDGQLIAGINGEVFDKAAEIHFLWIDEAFRGQQLGAKILAFFEQEARKLGAEFLLLDTFDFQAPRFYEKQGYELLGQTPPVYDGAAKYYYSKKLK